MNSRERLMATLRGEPVDRPAVCFYEVGGFAVDPSDPNPFNIYSDPSWRPLLQMAEEESDLIRMRKPIVRPAPHNPREEFFSIHTSIRDGSRVTRTTLRVGGRTMTGTTRRDPGIDTVWTTEYLLKDTDDLKAFLTLPDVVFDCEPDVTNLLEADAQVGERGIAMGDLADPINNAKALFAMDAFTVIAYTEPALFHQLLVKLARPIYEQAETAASAFPGHLWRIYGPEVASEPYLPPRLFEEYVVRYTTPLVRIIQKHGGIARIHCHGRLRNILPMIASMGADALDPIEPPPQGDMELAEVRRAVGQQMVLFGNIEACDLENLPPREFERKIEQALREGTQGEGRGFVLMPSASPYGRTITAQTLTNYETMIRLTRRFAG